MDQMHKRILPRDVLKALMKCWRGAVLWALILALVAGVGGLLWGCRRMSDSQNRESEQADYALALSRYHAQKEALEVQLQVLTESIEQQQAYLDTSLLMALDAYDFYTGTAVLQLHTDYQILPEMTYQDPNPAAELLKAYARALESGSLPEAMANAVDGDVRYMAELLTVSQGESSLTVGVRYRNAEGARLLLDQVLIALAAQTDPISATVAEHTADLTDMGVVHSMDASLAAAQRDKGDKLADTVKTLTTIRTRQTDLVAPTLGPNTWSAVGKRILLFALAGWILGAGAYLALQLWIYSDGDRLLSFGQAEALQLKVLGMDQGAYTVADISARLPQGGQLLLTGSLPSRRRQELADALAQAMPETQILCARGITDSLEALQALRSCDRVLLAEVRFATSMEQLRAEKQLIEDYGKELIGCLLVDGDKK